MGGILPLPKVDHPSTQGIYKWIHLLFLRIDQGLDKKGAFGAKNHPYGDNFLFLDQRVNNDLDGWTMDLYDFYETQISIVITRNIHINTGLHSDYPKIIRCDCRHGAVGLRTVWKVSKNSDMRSRNCQKIMFLNHVRHYYG